MMNKCPVIIGSVIILILMQCLVSFALAAQNLAVLIDVSGTMPNNENWHGQAVGIVNKLVIGNSVNISTFWHLDTSAATEDNKSIHDKIAKRINASKSLLDENDSHIVLIPVGDISSQEPFFPNVIGPITLAEYNNAVGNIETMLFNLRRDLRVNQHTYLDFAKSVAWNKLGRPNRLMYIIVSDFNKDELPKNENAKHILDTYLGSQINYLFAYEARATSHGGNKYYLRIFATKDFYPPHDQAIVRHSKIRITSPQQKDEPIAQKSLSIAWTVDGPFTGPFNIIVKNKDGQIVYRNKQPITGNEHAVTLVDGINHIDVVATSQQPNVMGDSVRVACKAVGIGPLFFAIIMILILAVIATVIYKIRKRKRKE